MTKKQFARLVSFLLIVALLITTLCSLFEFQNSHMTERLETYSHLEENTVDAIYVGTSGVHCFWIAAKAYEDYGMTVYPLTADALPSWLTKNMVVHGLQQKQNPSLVIIDVRGFTWNPEENPDKANTRSRRVIDMIDPFSRNRIDAIKRSFVVLDEVCDEDINKLSFYFPFIKYHELWSSNGFTFGDLINDESDSMGFKMYMEDLITVNKNKESKKTDERALDKYNEKYLNEFIDYLEEQDFDYLFVAEPRYLNEKRYATYNAVFDILDERNVPYVNYIDEEVLAQAGIDRETDFYDRGHTNFSGAVKFTDSLAKYIDENYDLPDRRNDEKCYQWHGVWDYINEKLDKYIESENKKK